MYWTLAIFNLCQVSIVILTDFTVILVGLMLMKLFSLSAVVD